MWCLFLPSGCFFACFSFVNFSLLSFACFLFVNLYFLPALVCFESKKKTIATYEDYYADVTYTESVTYTQGDKMAVVYQDKQETL